jgi:hypothetical protein
MTEREKADITVRAIALRQAGKEEEAFALSKTIPVPPFLATVMKEMSGVDYILKEGWNMAEAEAAFGKDWLTK